MTLMECDSFFNSVPWPPSKGILDSEQTVLLGSIQVILDLILGSLECGRSVDRVSSNQTIMVIQAKRMGAPSVMMP